MLPFYTTSLNLLEKREVDQAFNEAPEEALAQVPTIFITTVLGIKVSINVLNLTDTMGAFPLKFKHKLIMPRMTLNATELSKR